MIFRVTVNIRCSDMGRLHHNAINCDYLPPARLQLRINKITIDYDERNHDYNSDYICLETSSDKTKPI